MVRVFAETVRLLRRAGHAEAALAGEGPERAAFTWQMSRLAALEGVSFAAAYRLPAASQPANPFRADPATVRRVIQQYQGPLPFWR